MLLHNHVPRHPFHHKDCLGKAVVMKGPAHIFSYLEAAATKIARPVTVAW